MVVKEQQDRYVESKKPVKEHRFSGWYYNHTDQKYYRFDDLPTNANK